MGILVLNMGSTALKYAFFKEGSIPEIEGVISIGEKILDDGSVLSELVGQLEGEEVSAIGHRVVHGGTLFTESTVLTERAIKDLESLNSLAPLHNPPALGMAKRCMERFSAVPNVAVFDTTFFSNLPESAVVYPLPFEWVADHGIRRFGFHGISHRYCSEKAASLGILPPENSKLIVCHLGGGCSLTAFQDLEPIATTMGLTPADGIMMGSRPGAIDPGIPLQLLQSGEFSVDELNEAFNRESGLRGVSGISSDLQELERAYQAKNDRAELALTMFANSCRAAIGGMAVNLGGLDALVFTAGIGENSAFMRGLICEGLDLIGCHLSDERNQRGVDDFKISSDDSTVDIRVIKTREEYQIMKEVRDLL